MAEVEVEVDEVELEDLSFRGKIHFQNSIPDQTGLD